MKDPATLGAKLGPRIAQVVQHASLAGKRASLPLSHKLAMQVQHDFFNLTGHEIETNFGHVFDRIANHPDCPAPYARLFGFMARGYGQWQTLVASTVASQSLAPSVLQIINNELAPVVYEAIAAEPNALLGVNQLAELFVRGLIPDGYADDQARRNGFDYARFTHMVELATQRLDPDQAVQALHRGLITNDALPAYFQLAGLDGAVNDIVVGLGRTLQTPSVLAEAVVKGLLDAATGAQIAAMSGFDREDFALLTLVTGDSLDTTSLSEAYRRGIINSERLVHGIRTGLLRDEWVDVVEALRYSPPSPAEAIDAAVQNHLGLGEAENIAAMSGLDPQYFQWLYETAGSPLAPGQMHELYNRGLVTEEQVNQAMREGRTKDKYIALSFQLKRRLIEARQIITGISVGAITKAEASSRLAAEGFDPEDVILLIAEGTKQKTVVHHNLAYSQIVELYQATAIDRDDATSALQALGYDLHEINSLLALADLTGARKAQTAMIAAIRAQYLAGVLDEAQASAALDNDHVHPNERDALLHLWDVEHRTPTKTLTVAELGKLGKEGVITGDYFLTRIANLGYSTTDAELLAAYYSVPIGPPPAAGGSGG